MSTTATKIIYPTYEGEMKYPPNGYFEDIPCTCSDECRVNCKGECGCHACAECYREYLNNGS